MRIGVVLFSAIIFIGVFTKQSVFAGNVSDSIHQLIVNYKSPCQVDCLQDSVKVNYLNKLAVTFRNSDPDTAIYYSKAALVLSEKINWMKGIGQSNNQIGVFSETLGKYETATTHYAQALKAWNQLLVISNDSLKLFYYERLGATYSNLAIVNSDLARFDEASEDYKLAFAYYDSAGVVSPKAMAILNLGYLYKKQGFYSIAAQQYFKALTIFETDSILQGIANSNYNLGELYRAQSKYAEALPYYHKALKIASSEDIKKITVATLLQLGNINYELLQFDSAEVYYKRTLEALNEYDDPQLYNATILQMGALKYKTGFHDSAIKYTLDGIAASDSLGDKYNVMLGKNQLGEIYYSLGNSNNAEKSFHEALAMALEFNSMHDLVNINKNLYNLYKHDGNYAKALSHLEISKQYSDSIFSTSKAAEIKGAELTYEFDKSISALKSESEKAELKNRAELSKQRIIRNAFAAGMGILLIAGLVSFGFYKRKRDAEQKREQAFYDLQVSETEMKALRSQMNPHFIFNALQSIQTFLIRNQPEDANLYLLKFAKLMRAVLENSLESEVSVKRDLQALELYMQLESIRLPYPFTYTIQIDDNIDPEQALIPPLILQPFVENAIWHGLQHKKGPGHISIFIKRIGNTLVATVEDDGVGRDMSKKVEKPMLMKKESLGIKITEERLRILNDQKKIDSGFEISDLFSSTKEPLGTRIDLRIPEAV